MVRERVRNGLPGLPMLGLVIAIAAVAQRTAPVHLQEERKAAMVSNLLVVLCGEKGAQPILNTGTIYE